jgi:hypothetical protein
VCVCVCVFLRACLSVSECACVRSFMWRVVCGVCIVRLCVCACV